MKNEKELLFQDIKGYCIILDDYINKRYKYTMKTKYLEEEIQVVSACLMETLENYEKLLIEQESK